ncbi:MAG: hypothetical protein WBF93_22035 [Pirellulales bacterium]
MSLENWLNNAWLKKHETSPQEIANLLAVVDRDIETSQVPKLGPDWSFDIAYNAILQAATAALAAAGYQADRVNKHKRVLDSLEFTLGLDKGAIDVLDAFRRKRHTAVYEVVGAVSEQEASEVVTLAKDIRARLHAWLRNEYPDLV